MGKEEWIERASFVTVAGDDDDDSDLIFILNKSMNTVCADILKSFYFLWKWCILIYGKR